MAGFIAAVQSLGQAPILVIVDTLARCLGGGDENSARDMGAAITSLDHVRHAFGCAVLVLHHTGHSNEHRERGSSALRAAADTLIIGAKTDDVMTLRCEKQRNAEPFEDIAVRLVPVDIGGETSCVIEPATGPAPSSSKLTGNALRALRALVEHFDENGATFTEWQLATGISKSSFASALSRLTGITTWTRRASGRGAHYTATPKGREAAAGPGRSKDGPIGPDETKGSRSSSVHPPFKGGPAGPTPRTENQDQDVNSSSGDAPADDSFADPEVDEDESGADPFADPEVVDGVPDGEPTVH